MDADDKSTLLLTPAETDERWKQFHRRFAVDLALTTPLRDGAASGLSIGIDERLVQAIWHDQLFRPETLATASGKSLEIVDPGRWNTSRGPDFLDARIRLAGEVLPGDIEIHTDSVDWRRHGHHQNFEYNRVVLHVVLRAHDDRPYEEKHNGERLERLVIEPYLEPDLETIRSTINLADYPYGRPTDHGLCHQQFLRLPREQLADALLLAGRSRIESRIARLQAQMASAGFMQVVYQALMTAQGFKASKTLYFLLGKRAPLGEIADHARDVPPADRIDRILAILLHVAHLMDQQADMIQDEDEEAQAYRQRLARLWHPVAPYFSDRLIPPTRRWFAGMRPAGFPPRRLTAVSVLLQRLLDRENPLFAQIVDALRGYESLTMKARELKAFWKRVTDLLVVEIPDHYFSTHFTLGGRKQRPQALLGEPAAQSLLFNVFLPLAIIGARSKKERNLEKTLWQCVYTFPALEKNSVVRFMERRLFGESSEVGDLLKRELFQQSLLKIFQDCCSSNERTCADCTFYPVAESEFQRMKSGV